MRCVAIDINGFLVDANQSIESCTDFVLMSSSEWSEYPTLLSIFEMPIQADIQSAFMTGFAIPVIAYLTAWGYQTVINFINERDY